MARGLGFQGLVAAGIVAGLSHPAAGEEAGRPTIVVEVFDHADVPGDTLTRAKHDVSQIYGDVASTSSGPTPPGLTLRGDSSSI